MKIFALTALAALFASPALAQSAPCVPREGWLQHAEDRYGEAVQARGMTNGGPLMEIWANVENGSWTITLTSAERITCLAAVGTDFESMATPPGEPM